MTARSIYFFAKAQYAVFHDKDYAAALLFLGSLPEGFGQVVQFRGYASGLNAEALAKAAEERGAHAEAFEQYALAREYFAAAEGLYDSVLHLVNLPTPTPVPAQTPQPTEIPVVASMDLSPAQGRAGIGVVTIHETLKNGVNVRVEPDQNTEMIGYVPMFTSYICLSVASNGWKEILLPTGVTGFVSGKLVDYTPNEPGFGGRPTYSVAIGTVQPRSEKVRTYASTSFDSDFMGSISAGVSYPCVDININGGWCCLATTGSWLVYVPMESVSFTPY